VGILSSIFGGGSVISEGFKLIDSMHTSDKEEIEAKSKAKVDLMGAYAPFKIAQRYLALIFTLLFAFIMLNGILAAMYGVVDIESVEQAKEFANDMWLGEIMLTIIGFYFGGGFVESVNKKGK